MREWKMRKVRCDTLWCLKCAFVFPVSICTSRGTTLDESLWNAHGASHPGKFGDWLTWRHRGHCHVLHVFQSSSVQVCFQSVVSAQVSFDLLAMVFLQRETFLARFSSFANIEPLQSASLLAFVR